MTMPSAHRAPSPANEGARRFAHEGLRAGSGLVAGLVGGTIGAWLAIKVGKTHAVRNADVNVAYLAIFGTYGGILGGALLATNAAKRRVEEIVGWLAVGAFIGFAAGGFGSLILIRVFVDPSFNIGGDPETIFRVAFALIFASLGLSLGLTLGAVRGEGALLWTAVAGAFVGAFGGLMYVEVVLFSNGSRSETATQNLAIATLAFIGAGIGLALGAVRPSIEPTPLLRSSTSPPPAMPLPVVAATAAPSGLLAPSLSARSHYSLVFDDGRTYEITGRVIVGRDPQRQRMDDAYAQLVNIDDAAHTVSQTHFAIVLQDDRLFAEDRGSANGSMVVSPAGVQTLLPHETPVRIGEGWMVLFGGCRAHVSRT